MQTSQFADLYQHQMIMLEKSLTQSTLSTHLIQNYLNALYHSDSHLGRITLRIGQYCDILSHLMIEAKQSSALFITGCNPHSQLQCTQQNDLVQIQLHRQLMHYSTWIHSGESSDPQNSWPNEPSYLALGIDLLHSMQLGIRFKQNAIVWCNNDAIPRLILLR